MVNAKLLAVSNGINGLRTNFWYLQAHIMKYLENRGLLNESQKKSLGLCGDGEMDEPESKGAISLAGRENVITYFCYKLYLQRLDSPVRGNSDYTELAKNFQLQVECC